MMRAWLAVVVVIGVGCAAPGARTPRTPPVDLSRISSPAIRAALVLDRAALARWWSGLAGRAPLIEPYPGDPDSRLVTFVFRSSARYVGVAGGPVGLERPMLRLGDGDGDARLWYLTARMPAGAHFDYAFIATDDAPPLHELVRPDLPRAVDLRFAQRQLDPNNPNAHAGSSRVDYPGPLAPLADDPRTPRGTLTRISVRSAALGETRAVGVYLPAGHDPQRSYPLVIAFDGESYGLDAAPQVPLPRILDQLIATKQIPPVITALVATHEHRRRDLAGSPAFSRFIADELIPQLRRGHRAGLTAADTLVTGASLGGTAAIYLALHHASAVGLVLTTSAALWHRPHQFDGDPPDYVEGGEMIREFGRAQPLPLRFYLAAGLFEAHLRDSNRRLRDVLEAAGYELTYAEFAGGHDPTYWAHVLAAGLVELLAGRLSPRAP